MSNYSKLKTNLKLSIQRLKLLEKKKTELSLKARKEIADFLTINKADRARIRVEHIIREDNYVEAMEMLEMFADLLLARFGLIEKMKELDPGLDEAIATLIWASPRVSNDIAEFKIIADILSHKYGKHYAEACKADKINNVNDKVKKRLGLEAPSKLLVEQYLIEIAKNFNINYVPDNNVMLAAGQTCDELIQLREQVDEINKRYGGDNGGSGGAGGGGGCGMGASAYPQDTKQIPIGFNEIPTPSWKDLIDLGGNDINNNSSKSPPSLPRTLPSGNDHLGFSNSNNRDINNENILPPPLYYPKLNENDGDGYNKNLSDFTDAISPNAPPLPSKKESFDPMNDLSHSPPPIYRMNNFKEKPVVTEDEDDLGLPAVPNSQPDGSASIDYDELTKRFQNLKSFK